MQFTCDKNLLLEAINITQKAVAVRSTLPALEGLLIKAYDEGVKITGYDLEIGIEYLIEANVLKKGSIILNSRIFGEIVRKLPDEKVVLSVDDNKIVSIKCGFSEFNIVGIDAADYPEIPRIETGEKVRIKQSILKSMIRQTLFAVAQNKNKPVHTGSLFDFSAGTLNLVSVDGYRLAVRKEPVDGPDMQFVVPGKTLSEVMKILGDDETKETQIVFTKKHVLFEIDNCVVVSRLLEGEFLNYKSAIPQNNPIKVKANVRELSDCIERASLIVSEKIKSPIKLSFNYDYLYITCVTIIGKVSDQMSISSEGGAIEIGFNNKYIGEALKACEEEEVTLEFNNPLTPCVIKPCEGDSFTFLVLPVRMKAGDE